ncbi:MAG: Uncharacterised protein [SAR116 cluster bacterium]|nr:MAG: Uncharacterised protein [SAR116 cluster bacterium]
MRARCVIIFYPRRRMPARRGNNIAFGDNFDLVPQAGTAQRIAKHFFGHVSTIDIRLIHGGDPLRQAGFNLGLHMGWRGVTVIGKPPHAINNP